MSALSLSRTHPFSTEELRLLGQLQPVLRLGDERQVEAHPDRVADAVQALWESQQWLRQHPAEATAFQATFLKVEPKYITAAFKWLSYDPLVDDFTRQSIKSTSEYLATEGLISKPVDIDQNLKSLDKVTADLKTRAADLLK